MMIIFILFGYLNGDLKLTLIDEKFINKDLEKKPFNPTIIFDLSRALYSLATDLDGGILKDLDMKHYLALTKLMDQRLLVVAIKNQKKNSKRIEEIRRFLPSINEILFEIVSDDNFSNLGKKEQHAKISEFMKNIPYLSKEMKNLSILDI